MLINVLCLLYDQGKLTTDESTARQGDMQFILNCCWKTLGNLWLWAVWECGS